ncbi:hypothetical protein D9M68_777610 [compost metagenome]
MPGRQAALQGLCAVDAAAEERDLKAELAALLVFGVTRQVPPFGARVVVRAVVAREHERARLECVARAVRCLCKGCG